MKAGAPDEVLSGAAFYWATVSSWLGGRLLAAKIPIIGGRVTAKAGQDVPEKLTITVGRHTAPESGGDIFDWRPGTDPEHPLARFGQELDVTVNVMSVITGEWWETRVGRFVIKDWTDDDQGTVTVTGEGRLAVIRDDLLTRPTSPTGTLKSEARRLLPLGMGASFAAELEDRDCPSAMSWSENRLDALQEIADAWPAILRTDEWGQVKFSAPLPDVPSPVLTWTDGERGTVVLAPRSDTRAGAYNRVIARSSKSDAADIQGSAQVNSGPMSVRGPYGVVTKLWSSPLISTTGQASAAARSMLANSIRPAQSVPVTIVPDPRVDLDDPVEVLCGGDRVWGYVTGYDLPLTHDGTMRVDVGVPS